MGVNWTTENKSSAPTWNTGNKSSVPTWGNMAKTQNKTLGSPMGLLLALTYQSTSGVSWGTITKS